MRRNEHMKDRYKRYKRS